jgi:plastocyanin
VYRDEPTVISFWNLQADDEHDFMLADSRSNVLMKVLLPPLQETAYVFTFHQEGLFSFYCTMHQPEMSGQILVLPAKSANLSPAQ